MDSPYSTALHRLSGLLVLAVLLLPAPGRGQNSDFIVEVTPMQIGRAFHGAAVLNDFLFAFGGSSNLGAGVQAQTPSRATSVAKISPIGDLSRWIGTSHFDVSRHYISNSTIVLNDTVYVLGGSDASFDGRRLNTVAWTRPLTNGMLEPWRYSNPFSNSGLSCTASFSTPGFLHMTGGTDSKEGVSNRTWSVEVLADGSLGEWSEAPSLPAPLWYHCAAVVAGRAYVWGGLNVAGQGGNASPSKKVYSAPVLASGRLGGWREEPLELPVGFYSAETAVAGPYLFAICARYPGGTMSSDIWWTYVTPQGMRPWQRQATILKNCIYTAVATDYRRGAIYVTGGKPNLTQNPPPQNPQPNVYRIRLSPDARRLAEGTWQAASAKSAASLSDNTLESAPATAVTAIPGFYDLNTARQLSQRAHKPMAMYFFVPTAQPCQEQAEQFAKPEFDALAKEGFLAAVDANRFPQLAQQYGVFRVPTWVFFSENGMERERAVGAQPLANLKQAIEHSTTR